MRDRAVMAFDTLDWSVVTVDIVHTNLAVVSSNGQLGIIWRIFEDLDSLALPVVPFADDVEL